MARPTTKNDLITAANEQFQNMWKLIDSMSEEEQNAAFNFGESPSRKEAHWNRDKNVRDVLVHLYEWHQLLIHWLDDNKKGMMKPFLPEAYNWKTYGIMNVSIWKKHQSTSLEEARNQLMESHEQVMAKIGQMSNEELFQKSYFTWSGSSPVGSYCVSCTSSHYEWAIKKLKLHAKTYQAA